MPTFGKTTPGTNSDGETYFTFAYGSHYALSENGAITEIAIFCNPNKSGTLKTAIYTSVGGELGTKVWADDVGVPIAQANYLTTPFKITGLNIPLNAGEYFILFRAYDPTEQMNLRYSYNPNVSPPPLREPMVGDWPVAWPTTFTDTIYILYDLLASYATYTTGPPAMILAIMPATTPINMIVGEQQTFTAQVTNSPGGEVITWYVNGASAGQGASLLFQPSSAGIYEIYAKAVAGSQQAESNHVTANVSEPQPLTVSITPTGPISTTVGSSLTFTAQPSGGTAPYTIEWYINGTSAGMGTQFTITPSSPGVYNVQAMVTDYSSHQAQSNTVQVTATSAPAMSVSVTPIGPLSISLGESLVLTAQASGGQSPYTYEWYVDGTKVATGVQYTFLSTSAGNFNIHALATDGNNQQATSNIVSITVQAQEIFDSCDSLTPASGNWNVYHGTESRNTVNPHSSPACLRFAKGNGEWDLWAEKEAPWEQPFDFTDKELFTFAFRTNMPSVQLRLIIRTGDAWDEHPYLISTSGLVANQFKDFTQDLRLVDENGQVPDITDVRAINWRGGSETEATPDGYTMDVDTIRVAIATAPAPLWVALQPSGASLFENQIQTFQANVRGGIKPYSYAWTLDGLPVGTNSNSYVYVAPPSIPQAESHLLKCVVTDSTQPTPNQLEATATITVIKQRPPASALHVEGNTIKNQEGQVTLLRGVNQPGFVDSPEGFWRPQGGSTWSGLGQWSEAAVIANLDAMASWGMTCIRMHEACQNWIQNLDTHEGNPIGIAHRDAVKRILDLAKARGIYVILDIYSVRPYPYDQPQRNMPFPPYITVAGDTAIIPDENAFVEMWRSIAIELRDYTNVIFEIYNEPHGEQAEENKYFQIAQRCIDAFRSVGANQLVVIQWDWSIWADLDYSAAGDISWIDTYSVSDPQGNLIYSTHLYQSYNQIHRGGVAVSSYDELKTGLQLCKIDYYATRHPIIFGEIGADMSYTGSALTKELTCLENELKIFNEWGLGYMAYCWSVPAHMSLAVLQDGTWIPPANQAGQLLKNALGLPTPATITLNVVAGANGAVSPSGSLTLTVGQTYQFVAVPNSGYYLDHWNLNGTNIGSTNPLSLTATTDMDAKTLTAIFTVIPPTPITINIAVSGNGNTDLATGSHTFNVGDTVTVTAIPLAGNAFDQWTLDGLVFTDNPLHLLVTVGMNGLILTAHFKSTTITLLVVVGANGTVFPIGSVSLVIGQPYQFQATPNSGYTLDYWDLGGQNKGSSNPLQLTASADMDNATLTALFTAIPPTTITVTIAILGNGATDLTPGAHQFNVGDTIAITATPTAGNTFSQWRLNGTTYTNNPLSLTITSNLDGKTLTAVFLSPPIPFNPLILLIPAGIIGGIITVWYAVKRGTK